MPETLTIDDLCTRWQCDRRIVRLAIRSGELEAFRLGKRQYRFTLEAVERYEASKRVA